MLRPEGDRPLSEQGAKPICPEGDRPLGEQGAKPICPEGDRPCKIANQRKDFHHPLARRLVNRYGTIVHEALNTAGLARSRTAKGLGTVSPSGRGW